MKKQLKKLTNSLIILAMSTSFLAPLNNTYASEQVPINQNGTVEEINPLNEQGQPSTRSAIGTIAVYFGTLAVGWVIDGTITYATGHAPSEWVAMGLENIEAHILQQAANGAKKIIIPSSGPFTCPGVVIDHSGRG